MRPRDNDPLSELGVEQARRAIVLVNVTRVADSCGYGVPLMRYERERPHMDAWAAKRARASASAMARRIAGVGRVTVSLRRSTMFVDWELDILRLPL